MQQFYIQAILDKAQQSDNFNIVAKAKAVTIRRSSSGELAKLYTLNDINSPLLPNPFPTNNFGQFKFYAQDGKYKAYNANNEELAEFSLQDPFMTVKEVDGTPFSVTGQNHNNHFMVNSEEPITIIVGKPVMDSPIDFQTGILIYFTQIGQGVVILEPLAPVGLETPIQIICPESSSPQTFGQGATIAITSRNQTQWVATGNLGYG
jgi:hypothetical protein